jgi:5'(3')-deoxyribonucleotidase
VLAIDLDNTIADTAAPLVELIRSELGIELTEEEVVENRIEVKLPPEKLRKLLELMWADPSKIPLSDPDIPKVLAALSSKYEIHILTSTFADEATAKKWLADHNVPYDKYVHVTLPEQKWGYNADVFIDDSYEVVAGLSANGKRALLIKRPWNTIEAKLHVPKNVTVIDSWDGAEKLLMNLLRH